MGECPSGPSWVAVTVQIPMEDFSEGAGTVEVKCRETGCQERAAVWGEMVEWKIRFSFPSNCFDMSGN